MVVIITMPITIVMIIGWRRRKRWWPLWACAHLHRVINQALKRCGHRWNVGHWVTSSAPLPRQHTGEGDDKQEHKDHYNDNQHTPILLPYLFATHTIPFTTTVEPYPAP